MNGDSYLIITNKHSKNTTRVYFAILLTITLSLAFHAPLPEASAAGGDITAVKTQSEGNNLDLYLRMIEIHSMRHFTFMINQ